MSLNPHAQLVRIKTDLLGYIGITTEIETDNFKWARLKRNGTHRNPVT